MRDHFEHEKACFRRNASGRQAAIFWPAREPEVTWAMIVRMIDESGG